MTNPKFKKRVLSASAISIAAVMAAVTPAQAADYHWLSTRGAEETVPVGVMELVAEFQKTHPDFSITIEAISNRPSYLQKVKILATSGELPELFDADAEPYFEDIVAAGLVENVGELFDEIGITDKFIPFTLDYERFDDGSLWLVPFQANVEYFYYHKDWFEKAGVEPPKTIDEFLKVCEGLRDAGVTPIAIAGREGWPLYRYLSMPTWRLMGNEFLDKLKVGDVSMNSEAGLKDSAFFQTVASNYFQEGFTSAEVATAQDMFMSGQAAIYYTGTWDLYSLLDENDELKDDIGYFKMPIIDENDATGPDDFYAHSGIGTAIRAGAATDELKEFLVFLSDHYAETSLANGGLSSFKLADTSDLPEIYQDILADMDSVGEYARVWDVKLDAATVDTLYRQSQLLGLREITPEQFGAEIDRSIQQYLAGQ